MENIFKKYAQGVYCIQSDNFDLSHGDTIKVETKRGKEVEAVIWKRLPTKRTDYAFYSYVREDGFCRKAWMQRKLEKAEDYIQRKTEAGQNYNNKSNVDADFLRLGEPIKVGHHSEKKHRRILEKANNNMCKSIECYDQAENKKGAVATLEKRIAKNINIDTPDCIPKLEEKLNKLISKHLTVKNTPKAEREHSYSLEYANKAVSECEKKTSDSKKTVAA